MKGRFFVACAVALVGCRGIIGVQDLGLDAGADASVKEAGGTNDGSSPTDGALADVISLPMEGGGGPPPIDAAVLGACATTTGAMCQGCCRMQYGPEQTKLDSLAVTDMCICGGGACTTECSTSVCTGDAAAPPMMCGQCMDGEYTQAAMSKTGPCFKALMDCNMNVNCQLAAQCHLACPQ